ncbi:hypothetical protein PVL29_025515 [Vitis rotundifolia]|uniref:Uncharacterized protein n=1 Tax=Vitis rotundifolia TaxID=103349 RepID=A0AA38YK20_VITRO|nr:hypothetical protein PVL29_025515 [Vitis rotundifolia]
MSLPLSVSARIPTQRVDPEVARRGANYRPNFWGDRFLIHTPHDLVTYARKEQQLEELKDELRKELKATARKSSQLLNFIDSIQRLGLAYQFEREIKEALEEMYQTYNLDDNNDDLTNASLRFRLLRQEGYHIPPDVFNNFEDNSGNFKESLTGDLPGLLALYEATHLMEHGEDIQEEALAFSTAHLQSMATDSTHPLAAQVTRALARPIRKCLTRVEARHYISVYQEDDSHNKTLLKLAKLDFHLLQSLHRKELSETTRWWKGLDFAKKMPFARNRLVESYFWILGVYFEPQYSLARRIVVKVIALISIIDDIYDVYDTFEELKLFTEAIERWDASSVDQLPDYMKPCYQALLDVYEEMEEEMAKEGNLYNALVSCGYSMLTTTSFVGMGDIATKEAASSIICRLMDDIVSHEFEQKRGHVASAVECYMKQHGVCQQEAYDELNKQIVNAWKDINKECVKPTQVSMPLLTRVLNFTRVMDILYKDERSVHTSGKLMKDLITSILIDPVPM